MKTLVEFRRNWADEFDIYGFKLFDSLIAFDQAALEVQTWFEQNPDETLELYFGTNEGWDFGNYEDWYSCFTAKVISDESANTLTELFPSCVNYGYGHFMWPDDIDLDLEEFDLTEDVDEALVD